MKTENQPTKPKMLLPEGDDPEPYGAYRRAAGEDEEDYNCRLEELREQAQTRVRLNGLYRR